jgi:uncharacterized protein YgiM (DUF1202 family)
MKDTKRIDKLPEPEVPDEEVEADTPTEPEGPKIIATGTVNVQDSLRIRSGPSTRDEVLGFLFRGDKINIYEKCVVDGLTWGKIDQGWTCLDYVIVVDIEQPEHKHEYNAIVTAPTCTDEGYTVYACDCGDIYEGDRVTALGHDLTQHAAKSPTCTQIGWNEYETCSRCGHTTYQEIAANGHNHGATIVLPTCTEGGYTTYTCACGDSYVADEVVALGHNYETVTMDPTTEGQGYDLHTCSICGDTYKDNYVDKLPAVETEQPEPSDTPKEPSEEPEPTEPEPEDKEPTAKPEPETPKRTFGTVSVEGSLRIRKGPGFAYSTVGYLYNGDRVEIFETQDADGLTWGRIGEDKWTCLSYVKIDEKSEDEPEIDNEENDQPEQPGVDPEPAPETQPEAPKEESTTKVTILGTVIATDWLRIRSDAGTHNDIVGYYSGGAEVIITETKMVNGGKWGRTDKGWIGMWYVDEFITRHVTADCLRIRAGAGTSFQTIGFLYCGTEVHVTEIKVVDGVKWGKINRGWISLEYAK